MMIKYPLHKVAKDFKKGGKDLPSKAVMDILTQYGHPPKNHMQPLTDEELSIVFEYLTQNNQIDSIESVYADIYHDPDAKKPAPSAPKAEVREQPKAEQKGQQAAQPQQGRQPQPQSQTQQHQAKQQQSAPRPTTREKKVVDTRGSGTVNLDKYDERLESFTDQKQQDRGGKQKFQGRNAQRQRGGKQAGSFGNKR